MDCEFGAQSHSGVNNVKEKTLKSNYPSVMQLLVANVALIVGCVGKGDDSTGDEDANSAAKSECVDGAEGPLDCFDENHTPCVTSCAVPADLICYEADSQPDECEWCQQREGEFSVAPCSMGSVWGCFFDQEYEDSVWIGVAYYYSPEWTADSALEDCESRLLGISM